MAHEMSRQSRAYGDSQVMETKEVKEQTEDAYPENWPEIAERIKEEALYVLFGIPEWSIDAELLYMNWREK